MFDKEACASINSFGSDLGIVLYCRMYLSNITPNWNFMPYMWSNTRDVISVPW